VAVDVSAAMLHQLHESARALDLANIECAQSGFLNYEHRVGKPNGWSGTAPAVFSCLVSCRRPDRW
jgi:hypothetical protein